MRTRTVRSFIVFIYLFLIFLALAGISSLLARPATRVDPTTIADDFRDIIDPDHLLLVISNESPFGPTSSCKQCHRTHYDEWTNSMHYQAWRDPIFQKFYKEYLAYLEGPETISEDTYEIVMGQEEPKSWTKSERKERLNYAEKEKLEKNDVLRHGNTRTYLEYKTKKDPQKNELIRLTGNELGVVIHGRGLLDEGLIKGKVNINCLRCHAPGADLTMDKDMLLENNAEGVFCDYCHLIIDRYDDVHYVLSINSQIKQGPYVETVSSSHAIEPSKLITQSQFCKDCHQYENPLGVAIYNNYDEWFASDYNTGTNITTCQDCHMPAYTGRSAKNGDVRPEVWDHTFFGGNSPAFLRECATVDIDSTISTNEIHLEVTVTNERAGHNLPSSSSLRELILIVRLKGPEDETLWQGKRIYTRVYGDVEGNPTHDQWRAAQILSDTTLKSGAEQVEEFTIPKPDVDGSVYVTAQLFYRLTPENQPGIVKNIQAPYRVDNAVHFIQE
ncbi:MAG: multiheme c-type cytochrome [bacterium]